MFFSVITLIMLCFIGCTTSLKKDVLTKDMEKDCWSENLNFKMTNSDTLSKRDIIFILKYYDTFEYDKLRFSLSVTSPAGDTFCDTMIFDIPSYDKRRITILEHEQELIKNVCLGSSGVYDFTIKPLMELPIKGVVSVGLAL